MLIFLSNIKVIKEIKQPLSRQLEYTARDEGLITRAVPPCLPPPKAKASWCA